MRWLLATALFLAAALVWYLLIGKGLPYSTYTREYKAKDPVRDAAAAWDSGDHRFKGIYGIGLDAPGVPSEPYYTQRYGINGIHGTSDCRTCSEQGEFQHVAYEYSTLYNAEILRRIGFTPTAQAATTVALIQKQGGQAAVVNGEIASASLTLKALMDAPTRDALRGLGNIEVLRIHAELPAQDADLDLLAELSNITSLDLSISPISDAGLDCVGKLPRLEYLQLNGTKVTDAGLAKLAALGRLKSLYLPNTEVTDAGMKAIQGIQSLEILYLGGTGITDQGLVPVGKLENLTDLILAQATTDRGLEHLVGLKKLKCLGTQFTQVTPAGIARLRESLPQLVYPPAP